MCGYNVAALNVTRARRDSIGVKVFYRVYFGGGGGRGGDISTCVRACHILDGA